LVPLPVQLLLYLSVPGFSSHCIAEPIAEQMPAANYWIVLKLAQTGAPAAFPAAAFSRPAKFLEKIPQLYFC
jgi:hypothetical protein